MTMRKVLGHHRLQTSDGEGLLQRARNSDSEGVHEELADALNAKPSLSQPSYFHCYLDIDEVYFTDAIADCRFSFTDERQWWHAPLIISHFYSPVDRIYENIYENSSWTFCMKMHPAVTAPIPLRRANAIRSDRAILY
jgi:hypothetical protein